MASQDNPETNNTPSYPSNGNNPFSLKIWLMETRPQFLTLSVVLAFLGGSMAWYYGSFSWTIALLAGFGLVLAHVSVNTLNDYFDYRSGIDLKTPRTPFSGGSGILPASRMTPRQVFWLSMISFTVAAIIGIYYVLTVGWQLLPLLIVAGICIIIYSPYILRTPYPEWAAGLGLGTLPVLGTYFVQTGNYTLPAVIAAIPSGCLVYNLLFLNEFPDLEADKIGRRKTTPIIAGLKKAGYVYTGVTILMYFWIIGGVVSQMMPAFTLLGVITLPFGLKAIRGSLDPQPSKLMPGMANNVLTVLITQLLMGVGFILSKIFRL